MKTTRLYRGILVALGVTLNIAAAYAAETATSLDAVTVTGTREATKKSETPTTVDSVTEEEIEYLQPSHPSQVMNRMPGVHVNVTGGEGHMAAIRQPLSTSPLYLYLEDGIPSRSTGFFNHNALYEMNVPQSGGIEVSKGPGSALYGSDAIGAVINVLTRPAPEEAEFSVNGEVGEYGWERLLLSAGNTWGDHGLRGDLNLTETDGWRDATEYDRRSGTLRWDYLIGDNADLKTVLSFSDIDQQTAGSSRLLEDDYKHNPTTNYTPISYREVEAVRFSMAYEREMGDSLLSVTPYYRDNRMELLPNWALSYDPTVYETENESLGLLLKYRMDFDQYRTRLILGADMDYSPGSREEYMVNPTKVGNIYTSYTMGGILYDYDVEFSSFSPYAHLEFSPIERMRITAGLRYDHMSYDYDNNLSIDQAAAQKHKRPASTTEDFNHLSPKFGLTYVFTPNISGFASYSHAFRVPSEGQMFRQGQAVNTVDLDPVKVNNFEVGIRGRLSDKITYNASMYRLTKRDDILTYERPDRTRETMNAGETEHKGVELGVNAQLTDDLDLAVAYSQSTHTYTDWMPKAGVDYSGNEMPSAPESIANVSLSYHPAALKGGRAELEWEHLGNYWMDDANTNQYNGHDLLNFRINYPVTKDFDISARIMNLTDERYATAASYKAAAWGKPEQFEYAPGMPRTIYASISYRFR